MTGTRLHRLFEARMGTVRHLLGMCLCPESRHPGLGWEWTGGRRHRPHEERSKGLRRDESGSSGSLISGFLTFRSQHLCPSLSASDLLSGSLSPLS
jgi:hypothetical protein